MYHDDEFEKKTGIFVFKKLISDELCDYFIDYYEKSTNKKPGKVGKGRMHSDKKSTDVDILEPHEIDLLLPSNKIIYEEIVAKYDIFDKRLLEISLPRIQKYEKNKGEYLPHYDVAIYEHEERYCGMVYYLNDVKEGGETYFQYQDVETKANKGDVIVFPATWKYLHEGKMPKSNDKYIISRFILEYTHGKMEDSCFL